jgi:hypothetical protein
MEARVARLEAHVGHVASDVGEIKSDVKNARERLAALEVKVDHLPSKGFIVTSTTLLLLIIAALIAFAEDIQAFVNQ